MGIGVALPGLSEFQYESDTTALIRPPQRPEPRKCSGAALPQESPSLWKIQPGSEVGYPVLGSQGRYGGVHALK